MLDFQDPGHSIWFGHSNTWRDFHLFPTKRPFVAPPEPVLKIEEVEGMTGVLDYSNVLQNFLTYKDSEGTWEFRFIQDDENKYTWLDCKNDIYRQIHNKYISKIILEDDPTHFYYGRVYVESFTNNQQTTTVTFHYKLYPFKQKIKEKDTKETINGIMQAIYTNGSNRIVNVDIYCSKHMELTMDGKTYQLEKGSNFSVIRFKPGTNEVKIRGKGYFYLSYLVTNSNETTMNLTWNWDDLLSIESIYYGKFYVNGTKRRKLLLRTNAETPVVIYSTGSFTITEETDSGTNTYSISQGENSGVLTLNKNETVLDFKGTGEITLSYVSGAQT